MVFPAPLGRKNSDKLAGSRHESCAIQNRTVVALTGESNGDDSADRKAPDTNQSSPVVNKEKGAPPEFVADDEVVFVETAAVNERSRFSDRADRVVDTLSARIFIIAWRRDTTGSLKTTSTSSLRPKIRSLPRGISGGRRSLIQNRADRVS